MSFRQRRSINLTFLIARKVLVEQGKHHAPKPFRRTRFKPLS
jgi:hypothetical protein